MKRIVIFLSVVSVFFLIQLLPEATARFHDLNDSNLHQALAAQAADRLAALKNPLDFFSTTWACGFPMFGHYQMLPHLTLAALHLATFRLVSIPVLFHLLVVALLVFYPWNFYFAARRFGLSEFAAAAGAALSLTVTSQIGFGHEFSSYLAIGTGLFPQLVAMTIFPWTLVLGRELLTGGSNRWFWPLVSFATLLLAHIFVAYLAALILATWWLLGLTGPRRAALGRLVGLFALMAAAVSFFLVPLLLNSPYHPESRYEPLSKLNSYGLTWVLTNLTKGRLFDAGHLPFLTPLVALGWVVSLRRRPTEIALAIGFLISLLLFAGPTTWGAALGLLPMAGDMHFERFILGVHFFGVALAGVGIAWLGERGLALRNKGLRIGAAAAGVLLAGAILWGPYRYLAADRALVRSLQADYQRDLPREQSLFAALSGQPIARVFPGGRNTWGKDFKLAGVPLYFTAGERGVPMIGHLPFGWALPGDFTTWIDPFHWEQLDLFAVTHILSWRDDRYWGLTPLYADDPYAIYATPAGQHLFRVVDTPLLLRADKHTYWNMTAIWLQSPLPAAGKFMRVAFTDIPEAPFPTVLRMHDPLHFAMRERTAEGERQAERAVYDGPIQFYAPDLAGSPGEVASETRREPWTATVELSRPAAVILKMTYHPFWHATIDGRPTRPIMVSPGFVAVECPAGRHVVAFRYQVPWWKSALLLLLLIVPGVVWVLDRRRSPSGPAAEPTEDAWRYGLMAVAVVLMVAALTYGATHLRSVPFQRLENLTAADEALDSRRAPQVPTRVNIGVMPFDAGMTAPLGVDRPTQKLYRLDGKYKSFEALIGVNALNACDGGAQARFSIVVDDQLAFQTPILSPGAAPVYVATDLRGKKMLRLLTEGAAANPQCLLEAVWAEGKLYR